MLEIFRFTKLERLEKNRMLIFQENYLKITNRNIVTLEKGIS